MSFTSSHPDVVSSLLAAGFVDPARAAFAAIDPANSRRLDAAVDGDHGRLRELTDSPDACQLLLAVWSRTRSSGELLDLMAELDRLSAPIWPPSETVMLALSSWSPPRPSPQQSEGSSGVDMASAGADRADFRRVLLWARVLADDSFRSRSRRVREVIDAVLVSACAAGPVALESAPSLAKVLLELCGSDADLLSWVPQRLAFYDAASDPPPPATDAAMTAVSSSFAAPTLAAFLREAPAVAATVDLYAQMRLNLLRSKTLSLQMWELLSEPGFQFDRDVPATRFAAAAGVVADVRDGRLVVSDEFAVLDAAAAAESPLAAAMWAAVRSPSSAQCRELLTSVVGPFPYAVGLLVGLPASTPFDFWSFQGDSSLASPNLALRDAVLCDAVLDLLEADTAALLLVASGTSQRPLRAVADRPELLEPFARRALSSAADVRPTLMRLAALMARSVLTSCHCAPDVLREVRLGAVSSMTVADVSGRPMDLGVFLAAAAEQLGSERAAWQTVLGLADSSSSTAMTVPDLLDVARLINTQQP